MKLQAKACCAAAFCTHRSTRSPQGTVLNVCNLNYKGAQEAGSGDRALFNEKTADTANGFASPGGKYSNVIQLTMCRLFGE